MLLTPMIRRRVQKKNNNKQNIIIKENFNLVTLLLTFCVPKFDVIFYLKSLNCNPERKPSARTITYQET